jgi:hypothetical protein
MEMHLASRTANFLTTRHRQALTGPRAPSRHAADVIEAYIAIRDRLLREIENIVTPEKLDRLSIANDLVGTCLKPAPSSGDGDSLAESDAARERARCDTIRARIKKLRALVANAEWR